MSFAAFSLSECDKIVISADASYSVILSQDYRTKKKDT